MNEQVAMGRRVYVVGFSNGCILAAQWCIHNRRHVAGISGMAKTGEGV